MSRTARISARVGGDALLAADRRRPGRCATRNACGLEQRGAVGRARRRRLRRRLLRIRGFGRERAARRARARRVLRDAHVASRPKARSARRIAARARRRRQRASALDAGARGGDAFERACRTSRIGCESTRRRSVRCRAGARCRSMQAALSRMTGVRTRAVLLESDWHRARRGPLLGFPARSGR